jgi:putative DNA-invertase from lambdoid prophage Rac
MIYGYCRVSTDMQDVSAEAQHQELAEYAAKSGEQLGGIFTDLDVSGSVPLRERPEGKKLWDLLTRGDTLAITTRDRAFRSLVDAASTLLQWREEGIKLQILDFPVDLTTDEGELAFLNGAVFSQYERRRIGARRRKAIAHRQKNCMPYMATRPWGWLRDGDKWRAATEEQEIGHQMRRMNKGGMSPNKIAVEFLHQKKPAYQRGASGYYSVSDVRSLIRAAEAGYPTLPQSVWLRREREQTLAAVKSHGSQRSA